MELIRLRTAGTNALDLLIAFSVGKLWHETPEAAFYIISKDSDFNPLVKNLRAIGVDVHRRGGSHLPDAKAVELSVRRYRVWPTGDVPRTRSALCGSLAHRLAGTSAVWLAGGGCFLAVIAVLGTIRDYKVAEQATGIIALTPGITAVLVDLVAWSGLLLLLFGATLQPCRAGAT